MESMEDREWLGCDLIEIVPGKVSGAPVFKNTRLPVEAITGMSTPSWTGDFL